MDADRLRRVLDLGLPALVLVIGLAEVLVPFASVQGEGSVPLTLATTVLVCVALVWRRRAPLVVAAFVLLLWPACELVEPTLVLFWGQFVPMVMAVFAVARHGRGREPFVGAGIAAATLLYFDLTVEVLQSPGEFVFHWMVFTVTWCAGFGLRRYEERALLSQQQAVAAEVAAAEQALAAVVEERTRIARELHDVVAHAVSTMVVQAGAAEQVVGEDDATVRSALEAIRTTGAGALAEMRHVVTALRTDDDPGQLAPQPGVGALSRLIEDARRAGLEVHLTVDGHERELPAGVDLAAYRIVQEALTNVRRHAGAGRASVRLRYAAAEFCVEVDDDGAGPPERSPRQGRVGHGLIGMRERVLLYGGRFEAGAREEGGFAVRATLPLAGATQGALR